MAHPSGFCRSGKYTVYSDAGAGDGLGQPASDRDLCSLGYTIMNHFDRNLNTTFAGNEDYTTPVPQLHPLKEKSRKAHPTQHIDLKETSPVFIRDILKGPRLINAQIINQYLDAGVLPGDLFSGFGSTQVAGKTEECTLKFFPQPHQRIVN